MQQRLNTSTVFDNLVAMTKPTPAQIKKWKNEQMKYEKAEKKRRAKKITMTVGEFEDKLKEAIDYDY